MKPKQKAGTYMRLNKNTQDYEERQNRKLRRMIFAQHRKNNGKAKTEWRLNRLYATVKASRQYEGK